ncbi:MAG: 50S ribosomal protein L30 [Spirochaetales bacterium]|nr:50S ribosomal protein L30 [Spirochaetales bacterium]
MAAKKKEQRVRIELIRSCIGRKPEHVKTVKALGLKRLHHTIEKDASPAVMGMIRSVAFMLKVEEL